MSRHTAEVCFLLLTVLAHHCVAQRDPRHEWMIVVFFSFGRGVKDVLKKRLKNYYKKEKLMQNQPSNGENYYDYICVIDFEATCEEGSHPEFTHEIIEFPIVLLNTRTLEIVSALFLLTFKVFCRSFEKGQWFWFKYWNTKWTLSVAISKIQRTKNIPSGIAPCVLLGPCIDNLPKCVLCETDLCATFQLPKAVFFSFPFFMNSVASLLFSITWSLSWMMCVITLVLAHKCTAAITVCA